MRQDDAIIGVIAVSGALTTYDAEDVELLSAIARQTAVALENHRLLDVQHRHVEQLQAVNQFAHEIAQLRDAGALMNVATERIHQLFGLGLVTVFRVDGDGQTLTMQARSPIPIGPSESADRFPIDHHSIVGSVALTRTSIRHGDVRQLGNFVPTEQTRNTKSEMAVPIAHGDRLLGVLDIQSERVCAFDQYDFATLHTIADQLSVGLENSRLFAEEAKRTQELKLMLDTTRAASSSLLLEEVLEHVAEGLASVTGTDTCLIHLYDPEEQCFTPAVSPNPGETAEIIGGWNHVLTADQHPELRQILDDSFPQLICSCSGFNAPGYWNHPVFLVPLRTRHRTLGVAIVATSEPDSNQYPLEQMRLLQGVADSAALAVENARLYARAHGLAIAEERGRIAQEIHDTLAQGLTAISLQLDLADSYLPEQPDQAAKNVSRALSLARENLDEARRSVLDLRAADVHEMSLPDAISRLLHKLGEETAVQYELASHGLTGRLSARVEVGLYRIIEEALINAQRHSEASHVKVDLQADGRTVAVIVEDNGRGFDPDDLASGMDSDRGFGLLGIRERARLLGGSLTLSSTPGAGTSLRVVVPYEAGSRTLKTTALGELT
jgi:signal transduction histidine kinase